MLSISGLRARDKMLEGWIRRATFIIGASNFGGKGVSDKFNRLWPDGENGKPKISERVREQMRIINEHDAMERAKKKVKDGRT